MATYSWFTPSKWWFSILVICHIVDQRLPDVAFFSPRFSPNGQKILTASADKTCRLWGMTGPVFCRLPWRYPKRALDSNKEKSPSINGWWLGVPPFWETSWNLHIYSLSPAISLGKLPWDTATTPCNGRCKLKNLKNHKDGSVGKGIYDLPTAFLQIFHVLKTRKNPRPRRRITLTGTCLQVFSGHSDESLGRAGGSENGVPFHKNR